VPDSVTTERFDACVCGAVSVVVPQIIADEAPVSCGGCGRVIGSWLAYKSFVSGAIGREAERLARPAWICVDPMPAAAAIAVPPAAPWLTRT